MKNKLLGLFIIVAMMFDFVSTSVCAYNSNTEKISLEEAKILAIEHFKADNPLTDEDINWLINDSLWYSNRNEVFATYGRVESVLADTDLDYVFELNGLDAAVFYSVNKKTGTVKYLGGGQDWGGIIHYRDGKNDYLTLSYPLEGYLIRYDSTTYSPELAEVLFFLSWAAYNDKAEGGNQSVSSESNIKQTNIYRSFADLGFNDIKLNEYYNDPNDKRYGEDNCAFTIGHQKMYDGRNLIAVAIRGSFGSPLKSPVSLISDDKDSDWRSNLNFVVNENNNHTGFDITAKKVKSGIEEYVSKYELNNNVYVITGHSRGGGVGNLITKYMVDDGVLIDNIYNYNFACPNTTTNLKARYNYPNIFNICNKKDIVTTMPPSDLSWGKFGITLWYARESLSSGVGIPTVFGVLDAPIVIDMDTHLPPEYLRQMLTLDEIDEYEQEGTIRIICDNNLLTFDQPAMIVNDRTLVPLRGIFEALGATVNWNGLTQTATAVKDTTNISIQIGGKQLYVNGDSVELDVPAQIINDRTLVPARAVSEAFGCNVDWDGNTQTVYINSK